jgi:hypothetical protein
MSTQSRGAIWLPTNSARSTAADPFASVLYAVGETPPVVVAEMGHTSPLALAVYASATRRGEQENVRLKALVEGAQLAVLGSRGEIADSDAVEQEVA